MIASNTEYYNNEGNKRRIIIKINNIIIIIKNIINNNNNNNYPWMKDIIYDNNTEILFYISVISIMTCIYYFMRSTRYF